MVVCTEVLLLLLPQRYVFSSKSQRGTLLLLTHICCCCYHKGTYFQANHNYIEEYLPPTLLLLLPQRYVFSSKSQRLIRSVSGKQSCCCYHKGTYFQANHNYFYSLFSWFYVVVATTKVRIFKQITTNMVSRYFSSRLLLLPQRYVFSSKSQHSINSSIPLVGCCCYHKGTYFQANHNSHLATQCLAAVVVATTKVRIFKQITTASILFNLWRCCCCYHKGTYFQANHNQSRFKLIIPSVVVATTKVRIFKQITTRKA